MTAYNMQHRPRVALSSRGDVFETSQLIATNSPLGSVKSEVVKPSAGQRSLLHPRRVCVHCQPAAVQFHSTAHHLPLGPPPPPRPTCTAPPSTAASPPGRLFCMVGVWGRERTQAASSRRGSARGTRLRPQTTEECICGAVGEHSMCASLCALLVICTSRT